MNKRPIFAAVAATGFALAGCDSQAENEVEEQAEAIATTPSRGLKQLAPRMGWQVVDWRARRR